jgi:RimJ/RimL family protein N-acetyltransferase
MKRIVIGQPVVDFVAQHQKRGEGYGLSAGIGLEEDGKLIAGVVYNEYNHVNINMHVASLGNKRWMTREYLWMCFDYPFNQLKVKRITAFIEDENKDAIRFDEHLGFKYEARMKDAYVNGDILIYVMRQEDCRFIGMKRHEPIGLAA